MANTHESDRWPPHDASDKDAAKALYEAKVDLHKQEEIDKFSAGKDHDAQIAVDKANTDAQIAVDQAKFDANLALDKAFVDGVIEVAKSSIDRARASADTVQKAAAAILGIYTAVLGVSFSVTDRPLPPRGLVPGFLLGAAIVFSTIFIAYFSKPDDSIPAPEPNEDPHQTGKSVARTFVLWNRAGASTRRYWLRASVLALAISLFFLPAPFITFTSKQVSGSAPPPRSEIPWPNPPNIEDKTLANTLYTAQVAETAAQRSADIQASKVVAPGRDAAWFIAGGIGLLLALLLPLMIARLVGDDAAVPDNVVPMPMLHE